MRDYIYEMQRIAMAIDLDEPSICEYIVDGVTDDEYHRSMLYEAHTIKHLKEKLITYEKTQEKSNKKLRTDDRSNQRRDRRASKDDEKKPREKAESKRYYFNCLEPTAHRKERAPNAFRVTVLDICRKSVARKKKNAMLRIRVRK